MSRKNLSPVDIVGITLGVIVILGVIGSIALLARGRAFVPTWHGPDMSWFKDWEKNGGPGAATREEKDDRFTGDISEVEIRNIAGSIDIRGGSSEGVTVHSVKTGMFPHALENLRVNFERNGGRLVIEEKHDGGFMRSAGTISFAVTIPRGVKVVQAHSVSGSVTVDAIPPGLEQKLSTISGSITTSRSGNLDASSTSGSISFVFAGKQLSAGSISGSIQGRIESLDKNGSVEMHTVSGSVDMDAYRALDAEVSLHSLSGGVSCDFPLFITDQKRNVLEGKIGNGSARLEVTTTSGPISIRKM